MLRQVCLKVTARISPISGCFTTASSWFKKRHRTETEGAILSVLVSCWGQRVSFFAAVGWPQKGLETSVAMTRYCCGLKATSEKCPRAWDTGKIWSCTSSHRDEFYCKSVTCTIVKCFLFFFPPLRSIWILKMGRKHVNLNRFNMPRHTVSQK